MPLSTYQQLLSKYSGQWSAFSKKLDGLSFARLFLFIGIIGFGYYYLVHHESYWLIIALVLLATFIYCIRLYDRIKDKADFTKALIDINAREINFLNDHRDSVYADGREYINPHHPYSYDLDIFGEGSLYKFLNRATTSFGKEKLSKALLYPDLPTLQERQEAIRELSEKTGFRQHVQALGSISVVEQKDIDKLKNWLKTTPVFSHLRYYYILLVSPAATIVALGYYIFWGNDQSLNLFFGLFVFNLFIMFSFARKILKQMSVSATVTKALQGFAGQLEQIEKQSFQSPLLQRLQEKLRSDNVTASQSIRQLSSLFNYLDLILNLLVSTLLNGFFLFHVHILFVLDKWKKKNGYRVLNWLEIIGEFESLHCFANMAFNNRDFCYPQVVGAEEFTAMQMGHPLIPGKKRVYNDVSFRQEKFVVLTGSNMSGKSTFLRTLGINLILARAGGVTCARSFTLFPYDLHVSMRITDSLQDSESFFYAELKRLQEIIQHFHSGNRTFVILDEILRGTNSRDKHNGTIGLARKLAAHSVCGIIATHDLTIANLSAEYPGYMGNKCFESTILNDELVFDYKLKEGVCNSLNASFLMKKMGII
ncbi:MAG: DNA mismatch repair protein MutS [Bacteroidota bacterium]|nr:DNA mismatch repair protein MutS [Bacteroidota bacterium]